MSSGWRPWEKQFTVVQWDQRGAGRTYGAAGDALAPTMTLQRMAQDGIELVEYLRTHLHKHKIVLIGHSWGSFLGIHIVKQRPDLFYAYVGTGQVVGRVTFEKSFELAIAHLQELAQSAGNSEDSDRIGANCSSTSDESHKTDWLRTNGAGRWRCRPSRAFSWQDLSRPHSCRISLCWTGTTGVRAWPSPPNICADEKVPMFRARHRLTWARICASGGLDRG
ncbi:alpha/beta fold hydrolase [Bradyrhizobium betae]